MIRKALQIESIFDDQEADYSYRFLGLQENEPLSSQPFAALFIEIISFLVLTASPLGCQKTGSENHFSAISEL